MNCAPWHTLSCAAVKLPAVAYVLEDELRADRLVVADLADDSCEGLCHGDHLYFALVHIRIICKRNCISYIHLGKLGRIDPVVCRS